MLLEWHRVIPQLSHLIMHVSTQVSQYEVQSGNFVQKYNSASLIDGRIVMEVKLSSLLYYCT